MQFEFSAGGIVYKPETHEVLLAQHSGHHGWIFPKGHIGDHGKKESKEEAAIREVIEETGITAKIIQPLSPVVYWYVREREKIKKTVYYFLMEYVSGDTTKHDHEMENVEWLSLAEVEKRLTYSSDKKVLQEVKGILTPKIP